MSNLPTQPKNLFNNNNNNNRILACSNTHSTSTMAQCKGSHRKSPHSLLEQHTTQPNNICCLAGGGGGGGGGGVGQGEGEGGAREGIAGDVSPGWKAPLWER